MKLEKLTERIWYYPFETERDRPNLGYIRGDRWSVAVDAGHSGEHTRSFYEALQDAGLPLPSLTVLTHWHWDHTFGMHAVHGLCLSNALTGRYLQEIRGKLEREGMESILNMDECIRREYAGGQPVVITLPDLVFHGEMLLDAGNCPVRLFQAEAPHTDDSTLIYVPGEKVLFMGDAAGGTWPSWEKDPALCRKLCDAIRPIDAEIFLESHWIPQSGEEMLSDLEG